MAHAFAGVQVAFPRYASCIDGGDTAQIFFKLACLG